MSRVDIENIAKEYFQSLNLPSKHNLQPVLIGLIGSYGVGKSTIANKLGQELGAVVISSDDVLRLLEKERLSFEEIMDEKQIVTIGQNVLELAMKEGVDIVLDADLREAHFKNLIQQISENKGYKFIVCLVVAKEAIVEERIRLRQSSEKSQLFKEATDISFIVRKKIHESYPLPNDLFFTFQNDEENRLGDQIKEFETKLLKWLQR